jgi:hypothetical protein
VADVDYEDFVLGLCGSYHQQYGGSFLPGKGLRQGDPLSPILFNLVVDVLSMMLYKTASADLIRGMGYDLIQGGVM